MKHPQSLALLLAVLLAVVAGVVYLDSLGADAETSLVAAPQDADASFDLGEWVPLISDGATDDRHLELLGTRNLLLAFLAVSAWAVSWRRVRRRAR